MVNRSGLAKLLAVGCAFFSATYVAVHVATVDGGTDVFGSRGRSGSDLSGYGREALPPGWAILQPAPDETGSPAAPGVTRVLERLAGTEVGPAAGEGDAAPAEGSGTALASAPGPPPPVNLDPLIPAPAMKAVERWEVLDGHWTDPVWKAAQWIPATMKKPATWHPPVLVSPRRWVPARLVPGHWQHGKWVAPKWEPAHWEPERWKPGHWEPAKWEPGRWIPATMVVEAKWVPPVVEPVTVYVPVDSPEPPTVPPPDVDPDPPAPPPPSEPPPPVVDDPDAPPPPPPVVLPPSVPEVDVPEHACPRPGRDRAPDPAAVAGVGVPETRHPEAANDAPAGAGSPAAKEVRKVDPEAADPQSRTVAKPNRAAGADPKAKAEPKQKAKPKAKQAVRREARSADRSKEHKRASRSSGAGSRRR